MIKKPKSAAAHTTILPHTLQHADSIAGEMHRIALMFVTKKVLPHVKRRAAPPSSEPIPSPPKWLFNVSAGVGKTRVMTAAAVHAVKKGLRVVISVPTTRLGFDIQREIEKQLPGASGVWLGREQQDPNNTQQRMCPRHDAAYAAYKIGLRPSAACGTKKTGFCKHRPKVGRSTPCAYRQQDLRQKQIVIIAGGAILELAPNKKIQRGKHWWRYANDRGNQQTAMEGLPKTRTKRGAHNIKSNDHFDLLLVDETNPLSVLKGFDDERPFFPNNHVSLPFAEQDDIQSILSGFLHEIASSMSTQQGRHLSPYLCQSTDNFDKVGASLDILECVHEVAGEALKLAESKAEAKSGLSQDNGKKIMDSSENLAVLRAVLLRIQWTCDAMIFGQRNKLDQIAHLEVARNDAGEGLQVRRKSEINYHYAEIPTMLFDATGEAQLLEHVFGTIEDTYHRTAVDGAGVKRYQLRDETVTYSQLDNPNWARRIRLLAEIQELIHGSVGLVVPLKIEKQIETNLSPSLKVLHFGAERGDNSLETVASLIVASRLAKHPSFIEDMITVLTEAPVHRLPEDQRWFPKQNGFIVHRNQKAGWPVLRDFHPDADVECARRLITEAGLEQALARGRNVRRDPSKPLHEYVLTNAPTSRLVDGTFTGAELNAVAGWVGELLLAGVWVRDGKGQGVLHPIFRGICSQRRESLLEHIIGDPAFEGPDRTSKWRKDQLADNPQIARLVNQVDRKLGNGDASIDLLFAPFPLTAFKPIRAKVRGARYFAQVYVRVAPRQTAEEALRAVLGPYSEDVEIRS